MTDQIQPINAETQAKNDVAIFNSRSRCQFYTILKACRRQEEWALESIIDLVRNVGLESAPKQTPEQRDELSWKIATFFMEATGPSHKISLYQIRKAVGY